MRSRSSARRFLPEVWAPDKETRALRRRIAHRASLVKQRTRLRNQVHAVLARNLVELEASDVFGNKGHRLRANVELAEHERDQILIWAPCPGGLSLSVAIHSYQGQISVGLATDAGLVPNPDTITAELERELDALTAQAGQS